MLTLCGVNHLRKRLLLQIYILSYADPPSLHLTLLTVFFKDEESLCSTLGHHHQHWYTWESADRFKWGNLLRDLMFLERLLNLSNEWKQSEDRTNWGQLNEQMSSFPPLTPHPPIHKTHTPPWLTSKIIKMYYCYNLCRSSVQESVEMGCQGSPWLWN